MHWIKVYYRAVTEVQIEQKLRSLCVHVVVESYFAANDAPFEIWF
jgi:hypothetical protein